MRAAVLHSKVSHFSDELVKYSCPSRRVWRSTGTAAPIRSHGTRWCEWSGSHHYGFTPGEVPSIMICALGTHWIGSRLGPRVGLENS